MYKKIISVLFLSIFPVLLFANYFYDVRSVMSTPYISAQDLPMFTFIGNSLNIRDFSKDAILLNDILNVPNLDVKIKYGSIEKVLGFQQKKALAIALLRLVLKTPSYVFEDSLVDFSSWEKQMHPEYSKHIPEHKAIRNFKLMIGNQSYTLDLVYGRCFIKIKADKNLSEAENKLAFCEGYFISKEFCSLIEAFFANDKIEIITDKSANEPLFAPMSLYSENELIDIFNFVEALFKQQVFVAPADGSNSTVEKFFMATLNGKTLIELSRDEKASLLISMVRSVFVTDSLVSYRINPIDNNKEFALHFHKGYRFYVLYNNKKSVFAFDFDLKPETYRNAPASVLVKMYDFANEADLKEIDEGNYPPLFNSPETFCGQFSYFSPELLWVLKQMKDKYLKTL